MTDGMIERLRYDVVILGAGGAGLRAAIEAARPGVKVAVLSKSLLGKAHTVMAEGGMAVSFGNLDPQDCWQTHFYDTMRGGKFLNHYRMAEIFAKEAPDRVVELEQWGAVFDRTPEGRISQRAFGAHSFRRLAHVGDRTGLELIRTLQYKGIHSGMDIYQEVTATHLFQDGAGRPTGVFAYHRQSGTFCVFEAKAVVIATGGWGRMYKVTSNSWESTGEGAALAMRAGAEMKDMEMVQFHPTGMVWPPGARGLLVTEGVRGEGGILLNSEGERFMLRYDPEKKDLSSRDVVARSIYKEVQAGRGSPHGGAFLDITHRGADFIKRKLPNMYDQYLSLADIDITKQPFEVAPTIHYTMGGISVDPETGATSLEGLFAAGESACGLHGANRLGGNSLTDLLVFGRRVGVGACDYAASRQEWTGPSASQVAEAEAAALAPLDRAEGENPYQLHKDLQELMGEHAAIARNRELAEAGLAKLEALKQRSKRLAAPGSRMYNPGWHAVFEVQAMVLLAEAILQGALWREESRGAHWRLDFPDADDQGFGQANSICRLAGGEVKLSTRPVPQMPAELAALFSSGQLPVRQGTDQGGHS
jgi:succinate dehydrogenase / fumarate reductase flavoprotein subunit